MMEGDRRDLCVGRKVARAAGLPEQAENGAHVVRPAIGLDHVRAVEPFTNTADRRRDRQGRGEYPSARRDPDAAKDDDVRQPDRLGAVETIFLPRRRGVMAR